MNTSLPKKLNKEIGAVLRLSERNIYISIEREELIDKLKINNIVALSGNNADEIIIGRITKISKAKTDQNKESNFFSMPLLY